MMWDGTFSGCGLDMECLVLINQEDPDYECLRDHSSTKCLHIISLLLLRIWSGKSTRKPFRCHRKRDS